jgi:hypothetical protein
MHTAQDSLDSILVRFCRVLDCHFPAVVRPAVEFGLTAFDQDVRWIGSETRTVPGKTLEQLIGRKGLRLNELLKYAVQMAARSQKRILWASFTAI